MYHKCQFYYINITFRQKLYFYMMIELQHTYFCPTHVFYQCYPNNHNMSACALPPPLIVLCHMEQSAYYHIGQLYIKGVRFFIITSLCNVVEENDQCDDIRNYEEGQGESNGRVCSIKMFLNFEICLFITTLENTYLKLNNQLRQIKDIRLYFFSQSIVSITILQVIFHLLS